MALPLESLRAVVKGEEDPRKKYSTEMLRIDDERRRLMTEAALLKPDNGDESTLSVEDQGKLAELRQKVAQLTSEFSRLSEQNREQKS